MHTLNDVSTIIEHTFYVFRIDGAREVRIAVVLTLSGRRTYTLRIRKCAISACTRSAYLIWICESGNGLKGLCSVTGLYTLK